MTSQTLNYTPVAVGIVILYIGVTWIWARKWFDGPRKAIELERAGVPIEEQDKEAELLSATAVKRD